MVDLSFLLIFLATTYGIYLILALSFNLDYGVAGQPNLGKVFFYSIGAYVAGALTTRALMALSAVQDVDILSDLAGDIRLRYAASHPLAIIPLFISSLVLSFVAGGLFGYLASFPALRLRGDFLAIVLIAIGEVSRTFVLNYQPIAGGVFGLTGVPNPFIWLADPRVGTGLYAILVLALALVAYVYSQRLLNSPYGRLLKSIRDDEMASNTLGKRTPYVKGQVLAIGSGMAAVAGALYAFYVQTIYANDFVPLVTFAVVTMVIVGGASNNRGTIVGALVITLLDLVTRPSFYFIIGVPLVLPFDVNYLRYLIVGLIIILVLMFRPEGLLPEKPLATPAVQTASENGEPEDGIR